MKITCQRSSLQEALKLTARGVKRNSPIPILQNIKLQTNEELGLTLTATDYDLEIRCTTGCEVKEPGAVTVPAKLFLEIVGSAPASEITLTVEEPHQVKIASGRSRHRLQGIDPASFPDFPATQDTVGLLLPQTLLRDMFAKVAHAIATDDTRPPMTGAELLIDGTKVRIAATDTHRLVVYNLQFETEIQPGISAIIPKRAVTEMLHFLSPDDEDEEVDLRIDTQQVEFRTPFYTIKSRLLAGPFPKYDPVIQMAGKNPYDVSLPRQPLIEALKRVDILAREVEHRIAWEVIWSGEQGTVSLSSKAQDLGESSEDLEIGDCYTPESMSIWFRADQLLEALQAFDSETVAFVYEGAMRPVLLYPSGASYFEVLMPLVPPEGMPA